MQGLAHTLERTFKQHECQITLTLVSHHGSPALWSAEQEPNTATLGMYATPTKYVLPALHCICMRVTKAS